LGELEPGHTLGDSGGGVRRRAVHRGSGPVVAGALGPAGGSSSLEAAGSEDRENSLEGAVPGNDAQGAGSPKLEDLSAAVVVADSQIDQAAEDTHWSRSARRTADREGSCNPEGGVEGRSPWLDGPAWEAE
jgi:hypothetical protein